MGHVSHHGKHSLAKTAARIVLVVGVVTFVGAVTHFTYVAYQSRGCFTVTTDADTGLPQPRAPVDSANCRAVIARRDQLQRSDATIAILAIVLVVGAAVRLSGASRRTRRLILLAEVALVAVGTAYIILLATVLR